MMAWTDLVPLGILMDDLVSFPSEIPGKELAARLEENNRKTTAELLQSARVYNLKLHDQIALAQIQ